MADLVGTTIGPYHITEPLGVGGMAEVYKAYHAGLEVYRALKFIRPEVSLATDFRARFQKEARSVARLRHPNIVQVFDFGEHDGRFYMVMEYVDGQSLKEVIASHGPMPVDAAVALVKEVAGALDYAHQQGLIHRDIKPDNIMLDSRQRAVLMDFGIAKLVGDDGKLTGTGMMIGTQAYMAPEQSRGEEVGPYTDVYSLSVVLFELLTGRAPFQADTPLAVVLKSLNDPIPMPRSLNRGISESLQGVILKGTAKEASQRFRTAAEFMRALALETRSQGGAGGIRERQPTTVLPQPQPDRKANGRYKVWMGALAMVVIVAGVWLAGGGKDATPIPEPDGIPVSIETDPPEAVVMLAGKPYYKNQRLPPGVYPLEVSADGFESHASTITIKRGHAGWSQHVVLSPLDEPSIAEAVVEEAAPETLQMIDIPAGSFQMGCVNDANCIDDEKPAHTVNVRAFRLAQHEVTVGQFEAFVSATDYQTDAEQNTGGTPGCNIWSGSKWEYVRGNSWRNPGFSQGSDHPVTCVSWNDAQAFVEWLSAGNGEGYRLPTEPEFEYALRAGSSTVYPWGDLENNSCRNANVGDQKLAATTANTQKTYVCDDGYAYTAPVGTYPENAFGLQDMAGNVREWTQDCVNERYVGAPVDGSAWMRGDCSRRVARGASWPDEAARLRAAFRDWHGAESRYSLLGFRLAQGAFLQRSRTVGDGDRDIE